MLCPPSITTLLQQWAREYVETPKSSIELKHRACVRSLLFRGAKLYLISLPAEILQTFLDFYVYLFFGGLMITFHTINVTVAIAVDASAGFPGCCGIHSALFSSSEHLALNGLWGDFMDRWLNLVPTMPSHADNGYSLVGSMHLKNSPIIKGGIIMMA